MNIHDIPYAALLRIQQAYMVKQAQEPQLSTVTLTADKPTLSHHISGNLYTDKGWIAAFLKLNGVPVKKLRPGVQYKLPQRNGSQLTTGSIRPGGASVGVLPKPVKVLPVVQPSAPATVAPASTQTAQPKYNVYLRNILLHWNNTPTYFDALMDGIHHALMFDLIQQGKDTFVRTGARPDKTKPGWLKESSTAFGPYQITHKLAEDMFDRYPTLMAKHKKFYNTVLAPLYKLFLKHGNLQEKPWYDPRYDYGGAGRGLNLLLRKQYMLFARDIARIRFALMMRTQRYTSDRDAMRGFINVWHSKPNALYVRRALNRIRTAYSGVYK